MDLRKLRLDHLQAENRLLRTKIRHGCTGTPSGLHPRYPSFGSPEIQWTKSKWDTPAIFCWIQSIWSQCIYICVCVICSADLSDANHVK